MPTEGEIGGEIKKAGVAKKIQIKILKLLLKLDLVFIILSPR